MSEVSLETKQFADLFKPLSNAQIVPWVNTDIVGVSILKDYPEDISFAPAKTRSGKNDSVAIIRVGYKRSNQKRLDLTVSVYKASRYLLNEHWDYNFEDPDSPTEDSLQESKISLQPLDLKEDRYEFDLKNKRFYDREKERYVSPDAIVSTIFELHLRRAPFFRMKNWFRIKTLDLTYPIIKLVSFLNFWMFGKQIVKTKDFAIGIFETYPHKNLVSLFPEKIDIFGSKITVTHQSIRNVVVFGAITFIVNHYFHYDLFGIVGLMKSAGENFFFITTLTAFLFLISDSLIPHLLLEMANQLIRFRLFLLQWKITI